MLLVQLITATLIAHATVAPPADERTSPKSPLSPSQEIFVDLPLTQAIATTIVTPIAVRGSVMLLPIVRRNADIAWPALTDLRLGDGRRLIGRVARIKLQEIARSDWASPSRVTVTAPAQGDEDIVLLVPLPTDSEDEMYLGDQRIIPLWMDGLATPIAARQSGVSLAAADLPDPTAPSEYFRTVLQAYRLGISAPPPEGGELDVLYARAIAGLWSAAIARLEVNDGVTSNRLLGDLVGRAHGLVDGTEVTMAAWKTDDEELDTLLRALLVPKTDGIVLAEGTNLWLDSRSPLLCWLDHDGGESVVVGVANPRGEAHSVSFRWPDQKEASLTVEIVPETFQMFSVPRTRPPEADTVKIDESLAIALREHGLSSLLPPANLVGSSAGRSALESQARAQSTLLVEDANNIIAVQVGLGRIAVQPPGLGLGVFLPAANLTEIRSGMLKSPPIEWSTSAGLRRRPFGWELLVECRCPADASPQSDQVTVTIDRGSTHTITICSDGKFKTDDAAVGEALAVHRSKDRWRVRLPLPDRWVAAADGRAGQLEISINRVIDGAGSDAPPIFARRQFAGVAPLGVHPIAKGIPLDLSSWSLSSVTLAP